MSDWREFERRVAAFTGGRVVPGSGSGPFEKMDVVSDGFLWSCKATGHGSFSVTPALLDEVERAVRGPGGVGGDVLPVAAVRLGDGSEYAVMRLGDFVELLSREERPSVPSAKAESRRAAAGSTPLLRSAEGGD